MGRAITSHTVPAALGGTGTDNPFHDPLMIGIGIVFVIVALSILALTGLFYWGTVYHMPSWGSNSFPPPIVH
jgi:hypothetical protein